MTEKTAKNEMPFEKALERLEEIVSRMEEGELSLDEMIKYYEEGNRLSKLCTARLKSFEKKIEVLSREDADGGKWQEFDPESGKRITGTTAKEPATEDEEKEDSLF